MSQSRRLLGFRRSSLDAFIVVTFACVSIAALTMKCWFHELVLNHAHASCQLDQPPEHQSCNCSQNHQWQWWLKLGCEYQHHSKPLLLHWCLLKYVRIITNNEYCIWEPFYYHNDVFINVLVTLQCVLELKPHCCNHSIHFVTVTICLYIIGHQCMEEKGHVSR